MARPEAKKPKLDQEKTTSMHPSTKSHSWDDTTKYNKTSTHFTPEVLMIKPGETSYRFRVQDPGTYQCDLTRLVFIMTQQGQLSYSIIQWDEGLLQSAGKTPAGPLYNIQCSEEAVFQLQLPHCETQPGLITGRMSVVHISDDGMSFLQPRLITHTHVAVDVPHFSAFGLAWDLPKGLLNIPRPIKGQVLLFRQAKNNLTVNAFLLPENVPLSEVKGQQEDAKHIVTPSSCLLSKGHTYSLHCPVASRVQPACSLFDINYGPNYHPAFEIRLRLSTEEAAVTVLDQEKTPVWGYHAEFTGLSSASSSALSRASPAIEPDSVHGYTGGSGTSGQTLPGPVTQERKLFNVRTHFIDRVSDSVLKDLLDCLLEKGVINKREMKSMTEVPSADKAQKLIDIVLGKGDKACEILIDALCELDPFLSETLGLK